jgi:hypothetical protein
MPKRKVGEIENAVPPEEPRRSSRRKPNSKQEEAQVEDTKIAAKPKREAAKKRQIQKPGPTADIESSPRSTQALVSYLSLFSSSGNQFGFSRPEF